MFLNTTIIINPCPNILHFTFITGLPDFDSVLTDLTAELGQTVKLACKVTGAPKPQVTWYKGKGPNLGCFPS